MAKIATAKTTAVMGSTNPAVTPRGGDVGSFGRVLFRMSVLG